MALDISNIDVSFLKIAKTLKSQALSELDNKIQVEADNEYLTLTVSNSNTLVEKKTKLLTNNSSPIRKVFELSSFSKIVEQRLSSNAKLKKINIPLILDDNKLSYGESYTELVSFDNLRFGSLSNYTKNLTNKIADLSFSRFQIETLNILKGYSAQQKKLGLVRFSEKSVISTDTNNMLLFPLEDYTIKYAKPEFPESLDLDISIISFLDLIYKSYKNNDLDFNISFYSMGRRTIFLEVEGISLYYQCMDKYALPDEIEERPVVKDALLEKKVVKVNFKEFEYAVSNVLSGNKGIPNVAILEIKRDKMVLKTTDRRSIETISLIENIYELSDVEILVDVIKLLKLMKDILLVTVSEVSSKPISDKKGGKKSEESLPEEDSIAIYHAFDLRKEFVRIESSSQQEELPQRKYVGLQVKVKK